MADGKLLAEAIKDAIRYCIKHDSVRDFLEENGSEVSNMLLGEWKLEEAMEYIEEKAKKEGEQIGEQRKQQELIRALKDVLAPEVIAEKFQLSVDYVVCVLNGGSVIADPDVSYEVKWEENGISQ